MSEPTTGEHHERGLRWSPTGVAYATDTTTVHHLVVLPPITERQFLTLHAVCGIDHPGPLKPWFNDGHDHGGISFDVPDRVFAAACDLACGEGLHFHAETTITRRYTPTSTNDQPVAPPIEDFSLDAARLQEWLEAQAHNLDRTAEDAAGLTIGDLGTEDCHHILDRCVAELVDADILHEPPEWSVGIYPLDDLDQWGLLVTVRVSNRTLNVPFLQVADLGEDVHPDDVISERVRDVVATANRMLCHARAARLGAAFLPPKHMT